MLWFLYVSGIIRLRRSPPPKLRGLQYVLNVTATDDNAAGGPLPLSSSAQVIVGINDINNNKPVFEEVRLGLTILHTVYINSYEIIKKDKNLCKVERILEVHL